MRRLLAPVQKRRLIHLRDLLRELVVRDLKIRYKDSALGVAWSFINPLLHLLIFYFLFRLVLALNIRRYSSFAFCGMVAWTWFQASLSQAAGAIKSSRELVRQPGFPTIILPVVSVTANLINFLIALPILMLVLVAGGSQIGISILELPIIMVIQFVLTLSLAYLVAATNVLFRDTQHILGVLLQLYFFLTPVFYDASAVPERYRIFYDLNPMVHLVESYRAILLHGIEPHWMPLLFLSFVSVVLLRISLKVFIRASYRFVEEL